MKCQIRGFTLIELLLSVSILAVIAAFSAPLLMSFVSRNDIDVSSQAAAQYLRRAQVLAQAVDGDTTWGVQVQSGSITLFKGSTYASRDSNFDEVFNLSTSIVPSGVTEVVFSKALGTPSTTGTITLTSANNEARTIQINSVGAVFN